MNYQFIIYKVRSKFNPIVKLCSYVMTMVDKVFVQTGKAQQLCRFKYFVIVIKLMVYGCAQNSVAVFADGALKNQSTAQMLRDHMFLVENDFVFGVPTEYALRKGFHCILFTRVTICCDFPLPAPVAPLAVLAILIVWSVLPAA